MISKQQIEEIKSRVSLSEVFRTELGGLNKAKFSANGNKVTCCCPFHDDKNPSFEINDEKGHWQCYSGSCGGGDVISALQRIRNIDFYQALVHLADSVGYQLENDNSNTPRQATIDVSIFSNALYKHFKLADFNEKRNKVHNTTDINPAVMVGSVRCLESQASSWRDVVMSDLELKKAMTALGYDLEFCGLLDEAFVMHPIWRLKQDKFASPSTIARTIPTSNGPVDMEVVGFRVFNENGEFEGVFPQGTVLETSIAFPLLSFTESLLSDTSELVICDNYPRYLANLAAGNFHTICVGAELNYSQINSMFKLANKSIIFDCSLDFFQNYKNRSSLLSISSRLLAEGKHGTVRIVTHETEANLADFCMKLPSTEGFSEGDFYSLADFFNKYTKAFGLSASLPLVFKSIISLSQHGHSPSEFIDDFLLKKIPKEILSQYDEFIKMYGNNRKVNDIEKSLKYFGLTVQEVMALDVKHAMSRLANQNTRTPKME